MAGCTWATAFVRTMILPAADIFMSQVRAMAASWSVACSASLYVDDGVLMTSGQLDAVVFVHKWASHLLLQFITTVMHKKVAPDKLCCIASSVKLRDALRGEFGDMGFVVTLHGELLGADFLAGRKATSRRVEVKRLRKVLSRRGRLRWLRFLGGGGGRGGGGEGGPPPAPPVWVHFAGHQARDLKMGQEAAGVRVPHSSRGLFSDRKTGPGRDEAC